MPSINRIRVNNVKYNFGTQGYDDFSMRMYGRNTLYDLANGGGKSVLMLLLMQNLIPNCTLDDKQPIEKLFRDPSNTVIHSLIEWKLDPCDVKEGMRYMTTGFAAKKAATMDVQADDKSDDAGQNGSQGTAQTAQIEYFNYVIFYRDYNKNDIINLPLVKDNERISYKALRNYLHDLARNDKNMIVQIFDRKGEYQRFIADYGLYESHWEIIRGINKTEGHVRTYFETNYKTTRRVIEDLLIEEIIEKAYQAKTDRESDKTESTVSLLMTIQEELKSLAEKKRDIQRYDHEKELVQLLIDRIQSFMELYKEQEQTAQQCGRVLVTLQAEKASREDKTNELSSKVTELEKKLKMSRELVEIYKIYKEIEELEKRDELINKKNAGLTKLESDIDMQDKAYREKLAVTDFIELKKASAELEALKKDKSEVPKDAQDIYTVTANIRDRMDKKLAEIDERLIPIAESLKETDDKLAMQLKRKAEAETEIAVTSSRQDYIDSDIAECNKELSLLKDDVDYALMMDPSKSIKDETAKYKEQERLLTELEEQLDTLTDSASVCQERLNHEKNESSEIKGRLSTLEERVEEFRDIKDKFRSICSIYADDANAEAELVEQKLQDRLSGLVIKIYELKKNMEALEKREKDIRSGRLIEPTESVEKVIDYIFTRHSMQAMYGMDYISALSEDKKQEVLEKVPGLPYGIVVENMPKLLEDQGLKELDIDSEVVLYGRELLDDAGILLGDGVEVIRREREFFMEPRFLDQKLRLLGADMDDLQEDIRNSENMLETLQEDMEFVRSYRERGYATAEADYEEARKTLASVEEDIAKLIEELSSIERKQNQTKNQIEDTHHRMKVMDAELINLSKAVSIQDKISELTRVKDGLKRDKKRLESVLEEATGETRSLEMKSLELKSVQEGLSNEKLELEHKWDNKYAVYYIEGTPFPPLDMDELELEKAFEKALGSSGESRMSLEKEKLLEETLKGTIERITKNIEKLGVDITLLREIDKSSRMTAVSEEVLDAMKKELSRMQAEKSVLEKELSSVETEKARLEGSIEYARNRLGTEYGDEALRKLENLGSGGGLEDSSRALEEQKVISRQAEEELYSARKDLEKLERTSRGNDDLIKLAARIVESNQISVEGLEPLDSQDILDTISTDFDNLILKYDKISKSIDRAKADMLKVKMSVYDTLTTMNVLELAMSIREDVVIPDSRKDAEQLLKRLGDVVGIILLERDRIEKSLTSMQQLKDSFVDQCVERCLDVRSELDKLTKLSEITMGDEKVQMIRLTIPYVKDEFIKDRMAEYIDNIVAEVDKKENESERQKFLGQNLSMKKLFSVIVTDMSKIRLMLYKRERIREQSRYLRYEEAVGSTGQSQGIYIQFLISIINYIAGMYAVADSTSRAKTLFIDNPFGAAKDIYIWEPIFSLLAENNCQLIVPARGATPEITGKFDINYVLGQQMTGNRTTTVVVNYTSKTKGEELEYKALNYEQQTFDFI